MKGCNQWEARKVGKQSDTWSGSANIALLSYQDPTTPCSSNFIKMYLRAKLRFLKRMKHKWRLHTLSLIKHHSSHKSNNKFCFPDFLIISPNSAPIQDILLQSVQEVRKSLWFLMHVARFDVWHKVSPPASHRSQDPAPALTAPVTNHRSRSQHRTNAEGGDKYPTQLSSSSPRLPPPSSKTSNNST